MARRLSGWAVLAAAVAAAACLIVSLGFRHGTASSGTAAAHAAADQRADADAAADQRADADEAADRGALGACERRLETARRHIPVVAILGASYTAGTGPDDAARSWAVLLARRLGWNAVVYGVPGAGYVRAGSGHRGPLLHMLERIELRELDPSLVIVQLGHDDIGVPLTTERLRVEQAIAAIRAEDPHARIALVTVFTTPHRTGRDSAAWRTDRAIVSAARTADRDAIIMDPLAGRWAFPHVHGTGLHPTASGDAWIARKVASLLNVRAARGNSDPLICDSGISRRTV